MELLGINTYNVSWITSVHSMLMFLFASVSSIMLKRFSFRSVIFVGAILCSTSYLAAAFLPNYAALSILYAVIAGVGSGMLYGTATLSCV